MKRLKTYDDFLAEAAGHRFGCAMLTFDLPVLGQLRAAIDEDDLHVDPQDPGKFGFESEPHVTVLYGVKNLHDIPDVTDRLTVLRDIATGRKIRLHGVSAFKNERFDVLKYSAEGPGNEFLLEMNSYMAGSVEWENEHPDYVPHCTIAYLRPGESDKYIQQLNGGGLGEVEVTPKFVLYSRPDGQKTYLFVNK